MTVNLNLEDGTGLEVLKDASDEMKALATNFAGGSDPADGGFAIAYMLWLDTTNWLFKQRNADNDAWIVLGTVDQNTGKISWTNYNGLPITGGLMQGALFTPNPITIASVNGVVTLTNAGNSFVVTGSEAVTSIAGWTAGIAIIRWNSDRTITYNANSLILQDTKNRLVYAGDISVFEFTATGARELSYFPATADSVKISFPLGCGNYIADGLKISGTSGLTVSVGIGVAVINNVPVAIGANTLALNARKPCLIYADSDGLVGKVDGKYPTDYIDDNTIGFWIFNRTTAGDNVPNSAVGKSANAVANDLVPHGGVSSVDGYCDLSIKLDGTTGYYTSSNYTNIPIGANEREFTLCFTLNSSLSTNAHLLNMGALSGTNALEIYLSSSREIKINNGTADYGTGFIWDLGKTYPLTLGYDGTNLYVKINGVLIYKTASTLTTTATNLYIGNYISGGSYYAPVTLHYIEVRNKMRSDSKTAEIANKLLFPCFYTKTAASYPTIPSAYSATLHEYKFDEVSGTTISDSNTTSPLDGAATGTTISDSDLSLGKARKFNGTSSDYMSIGAFAMGTKFSYVGVINISSYANYAILWQNYSANTARNCLYIDNSAAAGKLRFFNGTTTVDLSDEIIPLNTDVFIAVTINGTVATVYFGKSTVTKVITIPTPLYTSLAVDIGRDRSTGYFSGKYEYLLFGNVELSQSEISQIYNSLMKTGRRSIIDDVVPSNALAVAFVKTNGTAVTDYNDLWAMYGRREKATGGNRKMFLPWQPFSGSQPLKWSNPFGTGKYRITHHWSQDAKGTNELECVPFYSNGTTSYGVMSQAAQAGYNDAQNITAYTSAGGVVTLNSSSWQTSGYICGYAEMLEDFEGVV